MEYEIQKHLHYAGIPSFNLYPYTQDTECADITYKSSRCKTWTKSYKKYESAYKLLCLPMELQTQR